MHSWILWSLLSALFAGMKAILAKIGVGQIDSNLATAVRTSVILVFTWGIALATRKPDGLAGSSRRTWIYLGERLTGTKLAGGALIAIGAVVPALA